MAGGDGEGRLKTIFAGITAGTALAGLLGLGAGAAVVRVVAPGTTTKTRTVTVGPERRRPRPAAAMDCSPAPGKRGPGFEPNDKPEEAPALVADRTYSASMENDSDEDWYAVCTSGAQTVTAYLTWTGDQSIACGMDLGLEDADGNDATDAVMLNDPGETVTRSVVATAPARYFVKVSEPQNPDCTYDLKVRSDKPLADKIPRG